MIEFGNNVQGVRRNTAGTIFAAELRDRFWKRPRKYKIFN